MGCQSDAYQTIMCYWSDAFGVFLLAAIAVSIWRVFRRNRDGSSSSSRRHNGDGGGGGDGGCDGGAGD